MLSLWGYKYSDTVFHTYFPYFRDFCTGCVPVERFLRAFTPGFIPHNPSS